MTSFHTNLAFDQEWAAPGESSYVDRLSHAMHSYGAAFYESTLSACFTLLKCTNCCGSPQWPHRICSFLLCGLVGCRVNCMLVLVCIKKGELCSKGQKHIVCKYTNANVSWKIMSNLEIWIFTFVKMSILLCTSKQYWCFELLHKLIV